MIYGIYVIKDEKVGYLQLQQDTNDYTAERNFRYALSQPSVFASNKKDYSLWKVGTFDSNTGELVLEPSHKLLLRAEDVPDEI